MRESIIAIVSLPFILMGIVIFYTFVGIFIMGAYVYSGIQWLFPYTPMTSSEKRYWKKVFRLDGINIKKKKS
jgi:hypothetical protein